MNRNETAEWLAEKVLGWSYVAWEINPEIDWSTSYFYVGAWVVNKDRKFHSKAELTNFIYSPEGFFAVWDAFVKMKKEILVTIDFCCQENVCLIYTNQDKRPNYLTGEGKDRYEAFYNAVYEVMKDDSTR